MKTLITLLIVLLTSVTFAQNAEDYNKLTKTEQILYWEKTAMDTNLFILNNGIIQTSRNTFLFNVTSLKNGIVCHFIAADRTLNMYTDEQWIRAIKRMKKNFKFAFCHDKQFKFYIKIDAKLVYRYYDINKKYRGEIVINGKNDCGI